MKKWLDIINAILVIFLQAVNLNTHRRRYYYERQRCGICKGEVREGQEIIIEMTVGIDRQRVFHRSCW